MSALRKADDEYRKLEARMEEVKRGYEGEIKELKQKLTWYIENQNSLVEKEQAIKERDEKIAELKNEVKRILEDPATNLDSKTNFYNR